MLTGRPPARALLSLLLVAQLLGCSDSDEVVVLELPATTTQLGNDEPELETLEQDDLPEEVAVNHQFGETSVPAKVERVAVIGEYEEDSLIALGLVPVAVTTSRPNSEAFPSPWTHSMLGDVQIADIG
ncbi:MAG TPA: hypothetical protein DCX77_07000, partial [Acidimicrobiaceae bacterium]|nr:hypothetical protein [Acidimicrobiaceae bacterium]